MLLIAVAGIWLARVWSLVFRIPPMDTNAAPCVAVFELTRDERLVRRQAAHRCRANEGGAVTDRLPTYSI